MRRRGDSMRICLTFLVCGCLRAHAQPGAPDIILVNGEVFTGTIRDPTLKLLRSWDPGSLRYAQI
jgi:hypothetical protein